MSVSFAFKNMVGGPNMHLGIANRRATMPACMLHWRLSLHAGLGEKENAHTGFLQDTHHLLTVPIRFVTVIVCTLHPTSSALKHSRPGPTVPGDQYQQVVCALKQ